MCTIILNWSPDSLLLLANRDERLDRPSEGWTLRTTHVGTRILAPRDSTAGGTWVGVNVHGLVVAITNHHTGNPPDPSKISRGALVDEMLDHATAQGARTHVLTHHADAYNPFHLVVADARSAFLWQDTLEDLHPGLHLITESDAHGKGARGTFIRSQFHLPMTTERAHALLSAHHADPKAAVCVHLGEIYGTRSSVMLQLDSDHHALHVTDQRPCITPWTDATPLLDQLLSS